MCHRQYLIQIDVESTMEVNLNYISKKLYWCVFLAKHLRDNKKSNKLCRYWTDWYRYTRCSKLDDIVYEKRVLVKPNTIPCSINFVQWATLLPLKGKDTVSLVGPFNIESIYASNRVCQRVSTLH